MIFSTPTGLSDYYEWPWPTDVVSVRLECWGGGGGGGRGTTSGKGGGMGGCYAKRTLRRADVDEGVVFRIKVGGGGGPGDYGYDSAVYILDDDTVLYYCRALGGAYGYKRIGGGLSGSHGGEELTLILASCVGDITELGGLGATSIGINAGGGGGGGSAQGGVAGSSNFGKTGGNGGGGEGQGGKGGNVNVIGENGKLIGGGGGGGGGYLQTGLGGILGAGALDTNTTGGKPSGSGANGQVKITPFLVA